MRPFIAFVWAVTGLLSACAPGSVAPYPTYTPAPTYTPLPTYTPYPPPTVTLKIVDDFFQESDIVVVKGTRVTWVNDGENPHSATSLSGAPVLWDTGLLTLGQKGTHTFSRAGTFLYFCKVHEYMNGTVRVVE